MTIVVVFGFLVAAIVMLCIPYQPQPAAGRCATRTDVVGRTAVAVLPLDLGVADDPQNQNPIKAVYGGLVESITGGSMCRARSHRTWWARTVAVTACCHRSPRLALAGRQRSLQDVGSRLGRLARVRLSQLCSGDDVPGLGPTSSRLLT